MILTGNQIINEVREGNITISPFDLLMVNPNSYNYRLGTVLYKINSPLLDPMEQSKYTKINLTEDGFLLQPHQLYLGTTFEEIGSEIFATTLIGRSSVGRLGLFVQITAPLGHVGTMHCWTLELKVVQPLRVYPRMKLGQVSFWVVSGDLKNDYSYRYCKYSNPEISKYFEEMQGNDTDRI